MHSAVQQRAYAVPTLRRAPHHSQVPFDADESFVVKPVPPPHSLRCADRKCWTAAPLPSAYLLGDYKLPRQPLAQRKEPLVIQAEPGFRRSYTSLTADQETFSSAVSTAVLPRRGQVKLTALSHEETTPKLVRAKTTGGAANPRKKQFQLGRIPYRQRTRDPFLSDHAIDNLTVGDLHTALTAEYPVSGSLRAARRVTAELTEPSDPTNSAPDAGQPDA